MGDGCADGAWHHGAHGAKRVLKVYAPAFVLLLNLYEPTLGPFQERVMCVPLCGGLKRRGAGMGRMRQGVRIVFVYAQPIMRVRVP